MKSICGLNRFLLGLVLAITATHIFATSIPTPAEPLDGIVAIINSEIITTSQLQQQMAIAKRQLESANITLPDEQTIKQKVLDQMIDMNMQLQIAKRAGIKISDEDLTKAITRIADENHLTLDQLKASLAKEGLSYDGYRKQIRDEMLITQVEQHALTPIEVDENEVKNFMRTQPTTSAEYHLANILIPLPANPSQQQLAEANQTANDLLQQLHQGADFQQLTEKSAQGPHGLQGGDLGWRGLTQLPEVFASHLDGMKVGDVAGPIVAPNGVHIIKLLEEKNLGAAITKAQARQIVYKRKLEQKLQTWLQELRKTAYIKLM